jgi:DnaJ-class molecular chaperone
VITQSRAHISAMAKDPYEMLGIPRTATAEQIKAAYRKLAKKHHPDLNPGNTAAEARFKAASAANELLSDPERRARFDRGEIDAEGQPTERAFYRQYAEGDQAGRYRSAGAEDDAFGDIFSELFRQAGNRGGPGAGSGRAFRQDQHFSLTIPFREAALGGSHRITLPEGSSLDVTIPPGLRDGQTIRLRGKGHAGFNGGPAGDAMIEVSVEPHPFFRRDGDDIHIDLPVTVAEAVLGGKVNVPTLSGPVSLTVPHHSDAGRKLRLRGRGIPAHGDRTAGDLYVTLQLVAGPPDAALEDALRAWAERHPTDPRAHLQEAA